MIRGSVKASAPLIAKISCASCHDPFFQNMETALCVWLEDEAQKF
jgi:hypothetical protein